MSGVGFALNGGEADHAAGLNRIAGQDQE